MYVTFFLCLDMYLAYRIQTFDHGNTYVLNFKLRVSESQFCVLLFVTNDVFYLQGTVPKKHSTVVVSETVRETGTTNGMTG